MTENKGDLISREALKEALSDKDLITWTHEYGDAIPLDWLMSVINNAPTVEPFEPDYVGAERLKARQRGYEEGYHNGMAIGKTLNPKIKQGEWYHNCQSGWHCSLCHETVKDMPTVMREAAFNYCPNCGADMRGKDDQLRDCENCIHHSDNGCEVWECEFEKRSDV